MQPGSWLANISSQEREGNQATSVVSPIHMLRNSHAPEYDGTPGPAEGSSNFANRFGIDTTDFRGAFWRVLRHRLAQCIEVHSPGSHERLIDESFLDDGLHHRVIEGDICSRLDATMMICMVRDDFSAGVHHDQLRTPFLCLFEKRGRDRMIRRRIRSRDERDLCVFDVTVGRRHGAAPDRLEERRNTRRVTQTRAVIDVVGPERRTDQLLKEIGFFV